MNTSNRALSTNPTHERLAELNEKLGAWYKGTIRLGLATTILSGLDGVASDDGARSSLLALAGLFFLVADPIVLPEPSFTG